MGGQHGYFGLWLDSDFGRGHSRARPRCTTYGSPQLSAEEDFTLDSLEVWGVGKPPEEEEVSINLDNHCLLTPLIPFISSNIS